MDTIFIGIQSSGCPHMGNIIGSIIPCIKKSQQLQTAKSIFFIADLHSLTSNKDPKLRKKYLYHVAATWLACGLDTSTSILFKQSDVPEVCELAWYLNCFTPFPMLANAHSFKDKSKNLADVNAGLFVYPILMAADILLYSSTIVPVGRDQFQHIEITRDIANTFNARYGDVFVIPSADLSNDIITLPGLDGRKMSKTYNNIIDIFASEEELKKTVLSIKTSSTPLHEPKDYQNCIVFNIFQSIATQSEIDDLRDRYLSNSYGFAEAKKTLLNKIIETFSHQRNLFFEIITNYELLDDILQKGASSAREIAQKKLEEVRGVLGF